MTDREKVIKGLESLHTRLLDAATRDRIAMLDAIIVADALALLKAQEPRVIDFDDVVGGDECWLETVNGACGYADCYACTGTGEVQVFRCNFDNPQYIMASDYLKTWRCWTSRPTDAQREATSWEP